MCSFMPAGESDFDSEEDFDVFEPGILSDENHNYDKSQKQNAVEIETSLIVSTKNKFTLSDNSNLRTAIINGTLKSVEEILINDGGSVDRLLRCDWTPLMYSCYFAQVEIVKLCIKLGADTNFTIQDGSTALIKTCQSPKQELHILECVQILLQNGADLHKCNNMGKSCLIIAAREARVQLLRMLLCSMDADLRINLINKKDSSNWTALDWSAVKGNIDCVLELLKQGALVKNLCTKDLWNDEVKTIILGPENCSQPVNDVITEKVDAKDINDSKNNIKKISYENKNKEFSLHDDKHHHTKQPPRSAEGDFNGAQNAKEDISSCVTSLSTNSLVQDNNAIVNSENIFLQPNIAQQDEYLSAEVQGKDEERNYIK